MCAWDSQDVEVCLEVHEKTDLIKLCSIQYTPHTRIFLVDTADNARQNCSVGRAGCIRAGGLCQDFSNDLREALGDNDNLSTFQKLALCYTTI